MHFAEYEFKHSLYGGIMKNIFALAVLTFAGMVSFAHAFENPPNVSDVSFQGFSHCIVYYADAKEAKNAQIVIACDGTPKFMVNAPKKSEMGDATYSAVKTAYADLFGEKCKDAGLTVDQTIETEEFWGVFCNKK
jgi:hypothetical protein